jgi:hypothetical protein
VTMFQANPASTAIGTCALRICQLRLGLVHNVEPNTDLLLNTRIKEERGKERKRVPCGNWIIRNLQTVYVTVRERLH